MNLDLSSAPGPEWKRWVLADSVIECTSTSWRFINEPVRAGCYTDAQIDDYQGLKRRDFLWRPPLTLEVCARFSHPSGELKGTAGFGFWNDPFMMTGARFPTLPRAIWFFYASPPSNMKLALDTPGCGWKVATIDATRLPFFLLAPTAPLAVPLMHIKPLYRRLWPIAQRAISVSEAMIEAPMTGWHRYRLEWNPSRVRFSVDGKVLLDGDTSPRGPLGFVMWIDNQAMILTPWGRFSWQTLELVHRQWMEVKELSIV